MFVRIDTSHHRLRPTRSKYSIDAVNGNLNVLLMVDMLVVASLDAREQNSHREQQRQRGSRQKTQNNANEAITAAEKGEEKQ